MMLTVLTDAVLRFAVSSPLAGSMEYVSFWYMVAIAFFGFALAERYGEHIDAPLIFDRLPAQLRREFVVVGKVLFLIVLISMAWWGWEEALRQYAVGERGGAAGVAIWPARFFVPIGATACAIEVIVNIFSRTGSGTADRDSTGR
ncbi:TRAP transporter small permease [Amycolatopsis marina]|nr:TRAP transporter small permease [Amycolatopsis marina]